MAKTLLVVVVFVVASALALNDVRAADPTHPVWPPNFSASIFTTTSEGGHRYFRWFYSQPLRKDRYDSLENYAGQQYFEKRIYDHVSEHEYRVFYQPDTVVCYVAAVNGTVPNPDLTQLEFRGEALIGEQTAYHWYYDDKAHNIIYQYWDSVVTREPLRTDFTDVARNYAETALWWEFDEAKEDPSLFQLPEAIIATCNREPVAAQ